VSAEWLAVLRQHGAAVRRDSRRESIELFRVGYLGQILRSELGRANADAAPAARPRSLGLLACGFLASTHESSPTPARAPPKEVNFATPSRLTWAARGTIVKQMLNQGAGLSLVFQALSDPTRRAMIERLSRGPATVGEMAEPFDMSLPAVMQHLSVLEASGLVRSEKIGRVRSCRIEPKAFGSAEHWIRERRSLWERRLDRLGEFLKEQDDQKPKSRRKS
jgi:DNA-binding transcriptional ArsR family regulator